MYTLNFSVVVFFFVLVCFSLSKAYSENSIKAFLCPPSAELFPFTCSTNRTHGSLRCSSRGLTQININEAIQLLRDFNNISSEEWLPLNTFDLTFTNLTQLDLTPLLRSKINLIYIYGNDWLSSIVGPPPLSVDLDLIDVNQVQIRYDSLYDIPSRITDEGLGDCLKYFSPASLEHLTLLGHSITGNVSASEFLPGLSSHINLKSLRLNKNLIQKLGPRQFQRNTKLLDLSFEDNPIKEISSEAFLFDTIEDDSMRESKIIVYLTRNNLTELNLGNSSSIGGLNKLERPLYITLANNKIQTLPSEIFQPILEAHIGNTIYLYDCPLICDYRLRWLKDNRELYEPFVLSTKCVNDPGFTIFTSNLI